MEQALVDVIVREDDSVQKKLSKKAIALQKKYYKRRKINERFIRKKTPLQKAFSIVFDILCIGIAVICGMVCFCNVSSRVQNLPPSIFGYMAMQVVSGSMVNSGFNIGDSIMIQSVQTDTLKEGDIIAFYVYAPSYSNFRVARATKIEADANTELKYNFNIKTFFGFQNEEMQTAAKMNSRRVCHQIIGVYEDADGVRWFETKGTSNASKDRWYIKETLVIGAYNNTGVASVMSHVINAMTTSVGMIVMLIIPLGIIAMFIVGLCLRDVHLSMLENDIVEEKRKLTDEICVRNKVGFQMSNKTKYKVLATASPEDKVRYVSLLWKDGHTPDNIKKYYLRKRMLLKPLEEKNALHRECERLFEEGENPRTIAKYYETESQKIEEKYTKNKNKIKEIRKAHENDFKNEENETKNKKTKEKAIKAKEVKSSKLTKETGVDVKTKKPTVNKKSTAKDSSSKGKVATKKPVSKTERLNSSKPKVKTKPKQNGTQK